MKSFLSILTVFLFISSMLNGQKLKLPEEIIKLNCHDFPKIKEVKVIDDIPNADIIISLRNDFMKEILWNIFNKNIEFPFTYDSTKSLSNHYILINRISTIDFKDRNVIDINVTGEVHFRTNLFTTRATINRLELILVPLIKQKDSSIYVTFDLQIKYLAIKHIPEVISECIANYLTDEGSLKLDSANISQYLSLQITNPTGNTNNVAPKIVNVNMISDMGFYNIRLKTK